MSQVPPPAPACDELRDRNGPPGSVLGDMRLLKARTDGVDNFPTVLVDPAAADQVGAELQFGERVLWSGRPDSRSWFVSSDLYLVPFSLLWGAFAIFWEASAVTSHGGLFFDVWGVPFVAIGLYMIAGRFIVRRRLMRRTAYAITEQRAIAIRPTWRGGRETTSVWFEIGLWLCRSSRVATLRCCLRQGATSGKRPASRSGDVFTARVCERLPRRTRSGDRPRAGPW
jgi:hypothetical protein